MNLYERDLRAAKEGQFIRGLLAGTIVVLIAVAISASTINWHAVCQLAR